MNEPDTEVIDQRVGFEQRFREIAISRTIDPQGMLRTDLSTDQAINQQVTESKAVSTKAGGHNNSFGTLVVPGLLGNSLRATIAPFLCARERLSVKDYDIEVAWVSGRTGCDSNAEMLRARVLEAAETRAAPVNLICYSKGCADALHMIGKYPDTHASVRAIVSFAGIVSGTPLVDSVPAWLNKVLQFIPLPGEPFGDGRAIRDLSPDVRVKWLNENPLPPHIRLASVVAAPVTANVSRVLRGTYHKLAKSDQHNDSQVAASAAVLPGGELLAVVNADHWAIALPIAEKHQLIARLLVDKNNFPRDVLLQAIIDHLNNT